MPTLTDNCAYTMLAILHSYGVAVEDALQESSTEDQLAYSKALVALWFELDDTATDVALVVLLHKKLAALDGFALAAFVRAALWAERDAASRGVVGPTPYTNAVPTMLRLARQALQPVPPPELDLD